MRKPKSPYKRVRRAFDRDILKRVCEMHETEFPEAYGMETTFTPPRKFGGEDYPDFFAHLDRGSDILAVAHLDTVMPHHRRTANFLDTAAGPVVYSGALDDRLGAYTILELLPALGVNVDVLLTTAEESCDSTAQFFHSEKDYNWMIEFDRGGSDVVMYQYEDRHCMDLVRESGARPAGGIFSDIAYLDHLGIKGFNWGVGYQDYHGPRSHAYLEDYWTMIGHYLKFHDANAGTLLPHLDDGWGGRSSLWGSGSSVTDPCGSCGADTDEIGDCVDLCMGEDPTSEDFNVVNERLQSSDYSGLWT